MAIILNRTTTFATNGTVTAAGLHNLIDDTAIYSGLITTQTNLASVGTGDKLLIAQASGGDTSSPFSTTVLNLFDDALTGGTYTNLNLSESLTYGTATGNRTVSTSATITTGTIPNLTSSTANITLGTIPTLTAGTTTSTAQIATSGTIATLNSTTGTIATLNSTNGAIVALSSTTGTISTLTSSTATVSEIATTKNIAINVSTLSTSSGTQLLDFTSQGYLTHAINGNITYTTTNYSEGKSLTVRITSDGTARNLAFPSSWVFVGAKPTSIAASKVAVLSITSFGTTEANTVAAYAVQT